MGIQINGQTDTIKAIDGTMTMPGTVTYEDVSRVNVTGIVTAGQGLHVTSGTVGIGTDNPESTSQLHIKNTSGNAKITLETSEDYDSYINFSGATAEASIGYEPGSNSVIISNSADGLTSSERLCITSSGNIGIGLTIPSSPLTVKEASNVAIEVVKSDETTSLLTLGEDGSSGGVIDAPSAALFFQTGGNDRGYFSSGGTFALVGGGSVASPAVSLNGSAGSNSMILDASSRLLIAMTSTTEDEKLQVQGGLRVNGALVLKNYTHTYAATSFDLGTVTSDGSFVRIKVHLGNSSGNYVFQEWNYYQGYAGTNRYVLTKVYEQKTDTSAPNVTLSVSSGSITSSVSNGSNFSGYYQVIL